MAAHYRMHVFCNACSVQHPTSLTIECAEKLSSDRSVEDIYDGREVPERLVMTMNHTFRCPNTGKLFMQPDNRRVVLVFVNCITHPAGRPHRNRISSLVCGMRGKWRLAPFGAMRAR